MREKMLAQFKAEDATLQKMIAELKTAPETKKPDLEAAILTELVAQHHQMLGDWEAMHARIAQFRHNHAQVGSAGAPGGSMSGSSANTAHK